MLKHIGLIIGVLFGFYGQAQELNCQVSVRADKIQATNKRIFETLETSVTEFLNNTKWGDTEFAIEEKISCSVLITIDDFALPGSIKATLQINASRPVYNSSFSTTIFNHQDRSFSFNYVENSPIVFTPNQFRSNIASVLAFYAYMILGYDADSFEKNGGDPYFAEAQAIVSNAQNAPQAGWKSFEDTRNRFWLIDNAIQKLFQPIRDCYYKYHRQGLDVMYSNTDVGRKNILEALDGLMAVHKARPLSFNMQIFFNTKQNEIISIFNEAPQAEKEKFVEIVSVLDPTRASNYADILK